MGDDEDRDVLVGASITRFVGGPLDGREIERSEGTILFSEYFSLVMTSYYYEEVGSPPRKMWYKRGAHIGTRNPNVPGQANIPICALNFIGGTSARCNEPPDEEYRINKLIQKKRERRYAEESAALAEYLERGRQCLDAEERLREEAVMPTFLERLRLKFSLRRDQA